jgi:exonuclease VII small subunit
MEAENISYAQLVVAFQARLADLEREGTDLDELATKLDEGFVLLERLKAKLTETEARVENILRIRHGE